MSMPSRELRTVRLLTGAVLLAVASTSAGAQGSDPRSQPQPPQQQQQKQAPAEPPKDKSQVEKFAEAARALGGPASNPECLWHGQRVVHRLYNDDMDTAFRHIDMYERFGCPSGHIQATFRCVLRQGDIDRKNPEQLNIRVHGCWINPTMPPPDAAAAAAAPAPAAPATTKQ
jgi:hypothetical protein